MMTAGERNLQHALWQLDGKMLLDEVQLNDLWFALNFDKPEVLDLPTLIKYHSIKVRDDVRDHVCEVLWRMFGVPRFLSNVTVRRWQLDDYL